MSLTSFDAKELDDLLLDVDEDKANAVPPVPDNPISRPGDPWVCGDNRIQHRVLCGDCTNAQDVSRLLGERKPFLMVTDPPYGIELDSEWRDRAGLNGCGPAEASYMKDRTEGHTNTSISSDTRADWADAFVLVPSLEVAYVWHASSSRAKFLMVCCASASSTTSRSSRTKAARAYADALLVPARALLVCAEEECTLVRKAGENSTIWDSPSPKFIMGGSDEEKFDHPT